MNRSFWVGILLVVALVLVACSPATPPTSTSPTPKPTAAPGPAPTTPVPAPSPTAAPAQGQIVNIGTASGVGSIAYAAIVAAGGGIKKAIGTYEVKVFSIPGDLDVMTALKDGTIKIAMPGSGSTQQAFAGQGPFKTAGLPPMLSLRQVWTLCWSDVGIVVRGDSNIKTFADLKGKRMAVTPTASSSTDPAKAIAAFLNIDYQTGFTHVPAGSFSAQIDYVRDGQADWTLSSVTSAAAREAAAKPAGIRWISYPMDDAAGKERWLKYWPYPAYNFVFIAGGKGVSVPPEGIWGYGSAYTWIALADTDQELIRDICRGLTYGYQYHQDTTPLMYQSSLARQLEWDLVQPGLPLHSGRVAWFKEIGVWTDELEKEQARRLQAVGATK